MDFIVVVAVSIEGPEYNRAAVRVIGPVVVKRKSEQRRTYPQSAQGLNLGNCGTFPA